MGLFIALVALVVMGSAASAGTITVWACHQPNGDVAPLDGWSWGFGGSGVSQSSSCAADRVGWFGINAPSVSYVPGAYGFWRFAAPPNTSVTTLRYHRGLNVYGTADYGAFGGMSAVWGDSRMVEYCAARLGCPGYVSQEVTLGLGDQPGVLLTLRACTNTAGCSSGSHGWLAISHAAVTVRDEHAPTVSALTGPLASGEPIRGEAALQMELADAGTGLYRLRATVDGAVFDDRVLDTNAGKCRTVSSGRDFLYAAPCRLSMSATTVLSSTRVGEGSHYVRVEVEDAAGNTTTAFSRTVTVDNVPLSSATVSSGVDGNAPSSSGGGSGLPNGRNAGASTTLRVGFPKGRQAFKTRWGARRVRVTGRLINAATGLPIAGAMVEQISRSSASKAQNAASRWLRTDETGAFSMLVPRNAPSQSLTFQYRPQIGTSAAVVASARLRLRVVAKIGWQATSSQRTLRFTGRLSRPVPRRPAQYVEVQWRRGTRWATLAHPVRVRANGTWALRYPVGPSVRSGERFQFRAAIRSTSPNYPYEATRTPARWVTVR